MNASYARYHRRAWITGLLCIGAMLLAASCGSPASPAPTPTRTPTPAGVAALPTAPTLPTTTPVAQSPAPTGAPAAPPLTEVAPATTYTVQPGDTLLGIALEHGVPLAALQLANDLGDSFIVQAGQTLSVPAHRDWAQALSPFWVVYLVQPGETLGELAARYGLALADLEVANPGLNVDLISIGQALVLPLDAPAEVLAAANAPEPEPVMAVAEVVTAEPTPAATEPPEAPVEPAAPTASAAPGAPGAPEPSPTPVPAPAPAAPAEVPVEVAALPAEIFRLLNEQRAAYGLAPLAWNETLARAAQRHANDCEARGYCGHGGSDGSTYKERIIREGYDPVRWSECWAWYGTAERAVAMWMDEVPPNDPHRRTILNPDLTEVGVGVVPGNGYGYYFIADFGKPR